MPSAKILQVALLWAIALAASCLLTLAGRLWPAPPPPRADLALALVVLPPVGMAILLLRRWQLVDHPPAWTGESPRRRESLNPDQDRE